MIRTLLPAGSRRREMVYRGMYPLPARLSDRHTALAEAAGPAIDHALAEILKRDLAPHEITPERLDAFRRDHLHDRLRVARRRVVPWIDHLCPLATATVLEIGCGSGSSTIAFAEQGATVIAIDVVAADLAIARQRLDGHRLTAELHEANVRDLTHDFAGRALDAIVFYASLEHMTHGERLDGLAAAWSLLRPGGLCIVVEAPNRLWFYDEHTALLPFFHWLPDELAFAYTRFSPRIGIKDAYRTMEPAAFHDFLRRGRGVSFHEFELAIGPVDTLAVEPSMYEFERRRHPLHWVSWRASVEHRYAELMQRQCPRVPAAFFEQSLFVALRKR